MPFTFAHPAIVLPLSKVRHSALSFSALIIGSMTPDFEYILQMKLEGRYSHTLAGAFVMDLPIGIMLFLVFHLIVKKPLIGNCPVYIKSRLQQLLTFNALTYVKNHSIGLVICLLMGIASHIIWDGFTHANGDFVSMYPLLSICIEDSEWPLFRYLQHLSTGIGFIAIGVYFHRMKVAQGLSHPINAGFWLISSIVMVVVFGVRAVYGFEYYGYMIVSMMSAALAGLVVSSILFQLRKN